jgi:hypothetical protein
MIMHDRHASETADLISAQYEERTRVICTAMEDLLGRKRTEIDDTIAKLKDEGTSDEGKITQAVEQIGKKYALLQAEVQRSAADDLETKHSQAQLDLRQRQLQEIANALSHLAPQDILVKKQAEQKQRQVEELAEFRRTMETEAQERIERIKREKADFEEKLRKQNEAEMLAMEQDHQRELDNQRMEGERKLKARKDVSSPPPLLSLTHSLARSLPTPPCPRPGLPASPPIYHSVTPFSSGSNIFGARMDSLSKCKPLLPIIPISLSLSLSLSLSHTHIHTHARTLIPFHHYLKPIGLC